jgi:hypothetical protein
VKDAPEADTVIRVLYDRYRLPLFGYILRSVGGDHQYAEDIVQETMVRAWQQASELDVERAGRWLFTVARHLIISGHRRRASRVAEVPIAKREFEAEDDDVDRILQAWHLARVTCRVGRTRSDGPMRCPETRSIGAYLLGALDPHEHLELEQHLTDCAICRQELVEVAHLPGLLHRLTMEDVTPQTAAQIAGPMFQPDINVGPLPGATAPIEPLSLPDATTAITSARPWLRGHLTRSRTVLVAAIIGMVLIAGVMAGRELLAEPVQQASSVVTTWSATDAAGGIDTTARLASQAWGTDIRLRMADLPPGQTCKLVVHARTGAAETAGWWSTNYEAHLSVPASTSIPLSDIDRVDVIRSDNIVLATLSSTTR